MRGGSFINNQNNARAAYRNNNNPDNRNNNIGFRVVCVRPTPYLLLIQKGVPLFGCSETLPLKRVCAGLRTGRWLHHKPLLPVYAHRRSAVTCTFVRRGKKRDEMAQVFFVQAEFSCKSKKPSRLFTRSAVSGQLLVIGIYKKLGVTWNHCTQCVFPSRPPHFILLAVSIRPEAVQFRLPCN